MIDEVFANNISTKILSKDIYKQLNVKQSYLCALAPEINEYIRSCREESNLS